MTYVISIHISPVFGKVVSGRGRGNLSRVIYEPCRGQDLTEFLDAQLGPLEMAIDNFRGSQEVNTAHTPHVRDIGRLMFRNHCLLDSRVFRRHFPVKLPEVQAC